MSRAEAFLQAIREDPDDDVARLVFADWLTDHGDPRGEFIHVQVRLASLAEGAPDRLPLAERAADLLHEHEAEWADPAFRMATAWEFRRGFVDRVSLRAQDFVDNADALQRLPLRSLRLEATSPSELEGLTNGPYLEGLEELEWVGPPSAHGPPALAARTLSAFLSSPHLRGLRSLGLTGNALGNRELETLLAAPLFPRLRRLDLTGNVGLTATAGRMLAAAAGTAGLEQLRLSQTRLGTDGLLALLASGHLRGLRHLEVAHSEARETANGALGKALLASPLLPSLYSLNLNREPGFPIRNLCSLFHSPQVAGLRVLRLSHAELGDAGVRALAGSGSLARLNALDLTGNGITHEGAQALADSPHLGGLTELILSSNALRDRGTKALAASPYLGNLRALHLSANAIGGPGLRALTTAPNLARLTALRLAMNFLGKEGLALLTESTQLAHLTHLDLSQHALDAAAAVLLARCPHLARLERLDLSSNSLGDAGLRALAASPWLTRLVDLELANNGIGQESSDTLAELLSRSPVLHGLRRLGLKGNAFSDIEKGRLRARFGKRLELG